MDFLRSCYRSQMRLFSDRPDVLTWGRWFFCPPNATLVPYLHKFGSSVWDDDKSLDDPPLGEVKGRKQWTNGVLPSQYTGKHFCGDTAWTEGILYADRPGLVIGPDGFPACCPQPPKQAAEIGFNALASVSRSTRAGAQLGLTTVATVTRTIVSPCAPGPIPSTLFAHFSAGGGCPDLDGKSFPITFGPHAPADPGFSSDPFPISGSMFHLYFFCLFGTWRLSVREVTTSFEVIGGVGNLTAYPPLVVLFSGIRSTIGTCVLTSSDVEVRES